MTNGVNLCPNPSGEAGLAYLSTTPFWALANDLEGGGQRYVASAATVPYPSGDSYCEFGILTLPALTSAVGMVYSWEGRSTGLTSGTATVYAHCVKSDGSDFYAAIQPDLDTAGARSPTPITFSAPVDTVSICLEVKISIPDSGSKFSLKNIQLELGAVATDFSEPVSMAADLAFDYAPAPPPLFLLRPGHAPPGKDGATR